MLENDDEEETASLCGECRPCLYEHRGQVDIGLDCTEWFRTAFVYVLQI